MRLLLHSKSVFVLIPAIFLLLYGGTAPAQEKAMEGKDKVAVESVETNGAYHLNVINDNPFSITLTLEVEGENYKMNARQPISKVVGGNATKHMVSIYPEDKEKNFSFSTSYKWVMGNTRARHNNTYIYRLPFKTGDRYRVGQSYDGSFSHSGEIRYSVDFMMPEETQVYAARGGRVVQIYEESDQGGNSMEFKDMANFVVIEHNDGTFSEYAHLSQNGVLVRLGQKIYEGQLIGLSGNTGYSSGPHLHFMVISVNKDGSHESIPVRFKTREGIFSRLTEGTIYTAN